MIAAVVIPVWMYLTIVLGIFTGGFVMGHEVHRIRNTKHR
jgi:uncharacterized protein YneF (UPF0154 family)